MAAKARAGAKAKKTWDRPGNARWLELAAEFPLRPIRSDEEVARAIALVDRLTDQPALGDEELDYRDSLGNLIADYEDEHEPMDDPTPGGMLRHLLDSRGVSQVEAAEGAGISEATVSQILSGKRPPSRKAIAALAAYFRVDPAVFL
jgi:HTH-type transcriptional regulator/antitoxin HigA